jgi:hypothetical protein
VACPFCWIKSASLSWRLKDRASEPTPIKAYQSLPLLAVISGTLADFTIANVLFAVRQERSTPYGRPYLWTLHSENSGAENKGFAVLAIFINRLYLRTNVVI